MRRLSLTFYFVLLFSTLNVVATSSLPDNSIEKKQNFTDSQGRRQGYWVIVGAFSSDYGYSQNQKVEEGEYLDNKRTGVWKKYYPTGSLQSEINYVENHPYGHYTTYHPNNRVEESGYWKANKNTGDFKRFHENGQLAQDFNFNSKGKRDGLQQYFYPDGTLQLTVEIENGVAHGIYRSYYPNGAIREEKRITNGETEPGSVTHFSLPRESKKEVIVPDLPESETTPINSDKPNLGIFKSTGFNTLYNRSKQITQVGDFFEGRLWNGKWYKYDENGILRKVEIYKEGRFIGYGIIDDSNN